jgi:signal transduction histidine kinase
MVAALSLVEEEATLRNLALTLVALSTGLWMCALVCGGRICRRAIRPLSEMAEAAHAIGGDQPEARLPSPRTDDEIGELGLAFNSLLDRLHESAERQRRFAGDASHQLRTPLTVIQGNLDLALRQPRSEEEYRRVLALVGEKTRHMTRIVEALLFLARADAESQQPRLESIDLRSWLVEHIEARQWGRSRDLRLDLDHGFSTRVAVHRPLLAELVDNLLDNAAKYSQAGTPIDVRMSHVEGEIHLAVEDRGIGIEESEIPNLFDPFYRSPRARRGGMSGLGLGLSVAARLARAFGGRIDIESQPGKGSIFTLVLPIEEAGGP